MTGDPAAISDARVSGTLVIEKPFIANEVRALMDSITLAAQLDYVPPRAATR